MALLGNNTNSSGLMSSLSLGRPSNNASSTPGMTGGFIQTRRPSTQQQQLSPRQIQQLNQTVPNNNPNSSLTSANLQQQMNNINNQFNDSVNRQIASLDSVATRMTQAINQQTTTLVSSLKGIKDEIGLGFRNTLETLNKLFSERVAAYNRDQEIQLQNDEFKDYTTKFFSNFIENKLMDLVRDITTSQLKSLKELKETTLHYFMQNESFAKFIGLNAPYGSQKNEFQSVPFTKDIADSIISSASTLSQIYEELSVSNQYTAHMIDSNGPLMELNKSFLKIIESSKNIESNTGITNSLLEELLKNSEEYANEATIVDDIKNNEVFKDMFQNRYSNFQDNDIQYNELVSKIDDEFKKYSTSRTEEEILNQIVNNEAFKKFFEKFNLNFKDKGITDLNKTLRSFDIKKLEETDFKDSLKELKNLISTELTSKDKSVIKILDKINDLDNSKQKEKENLQNSFELLKELVKDIDKAKENDKTRESLERLQKILPKLKETRELDKFLKDFKKTSRTKEIENRINSKVSKVNLEKFTTQLTDSINQHRLSLVKNTETVEKQITALDVLKTSALAIVNPMNWKRVIWSFGKWFGKFYIPYRMLMWKGGLIKSGANLLGGIGLPGWMQPKDKEGNVTATTVGGVVSNIYSRAKIFIKDLADPLIVGFKNVLHEWLSPEWFNRIEKVWTWTKNYTSDIYTTLFGSNLIEREEARKRLFEPVRHITSWVTEKILIPGIIKGIGIYTVGKNLLHPIQFLKNFDTGVLGGYFHRKAYAASENIRNYRDQKLANRVFGNMYDNLQYQYGAEHNISKLDEVRADIGFQKFATKKFMEQGVSKNYAKEMARTGAPVTPSKVGALQNSFRIFGKFTSWLGKATYYIGGFIAMLQIGQKVWSWISEGWDWARAKKGGFSSVVSSMVFRGINMIVDSALEGLKFLKNFGWEILVGLKDGVGKVVDKLMDRARDSIEVSSAYKQANSGVTSSTMDAIVNEFAPQREASTDKFILKQYESELIKIKDENLQKQVRDSLMGLATAIRNNNSDTYIENNFITNEEGNKVISKDNITQEVFKILKQGIGHDQNFNDQDIESFKRLLPSTVLGNGQRVLNDVHDELVSSMNEQYFGNSMAAYAAFTKNEFEKFFNKDKVFTTEEEKLQNMGEFRTYIFEKYEELEKIQAGLGKGALELHKRLSENITTGAKYDEFVSKQVPIMLKMIEDKHFLQLGAIKSAEEMDKEFLSALQQFNKGKFKEALKEKDAATRQLKLYKLFDEMYKEAKNKKDDKDKNKEEPKFENPVNQPPPSDGVTASLGTLSQWIQSGSAKKWFGEQFNKLGEHIKGAWMFLKNQDYKKMFGDAMATFGGVTGNIMSALFGEDTATKWLNEAYQYADKKGYATAKRFLSGARSSLISNVKDIKGYLLETNQSLNEIVEILKKDRESKGEKFDYEEWKKKVNYNPTPVDLSNAKNALEATMNYAGNVAYGAHRDANGKFVRLNRLVKDANGFWIPGSQNTNGIGTLDCSQYVSMMLTNAGVKNYIDKSGNAATSVSMYNELSSKNSGATLRSSWKEAQAGDILFKMNHNRTEFDKSRGIHQPTHVALVLKDPKTQKLVVAESSGSMTKFGKGVKTTPIENSGWWHDIAYTKVFSYPKSNSIFGSDEVFVKQLKRDKNKDKVDTFDFAKQVLDNYEGGYTHNKENLNELVYGLKYTDIKSYAEDSGNAYQLSEPFKKVLLEATSTNDDNKLKENLNKLVEDTKYKNDFKKLATQVLNSKKFTELNGVRFNDLNKNIGYLLQDHAFDTGDVSNIVKTVSGETDLDEGIKILQKRSIEDSIKLGTDILNARVMEYKEKNIPEKMWVNRLTDLGKKLGYAYDDRTNTFRYLEGFNMPTIDGEYNVKLNNPNLTKNIGMALDKGEGGFKLGLNTKTDYVYGLQFDKIKNYVKNSSKYGMRDEFKSVLEKAVNSQDPKQALIDLVKNPNGSYNTTYKNDFKNLAAQVMLKDFGKFGNFNLEELTFPSSYFLMDQNYHRPAGVIPTIKYASGKSDAKQGFEYLKSLSQKDPYGTGALILYGRYRYWNEDFRKSHPQSKYINGYINRIKRISEPLGYRMTSDGHFEYISGLAQTDFNQSENVSTLGLKGPSKLKDLTTEQVNAKRKADQFSSLKLYEGILKGENNAVAHAFGGTAEIEKILKDPTKGKAFSTKWLPVLKDKTAEQIQEALLHPELDGNQKVVDAINALGDLLKTNTDKLTESGKNFVFNVITDASIKSSSHSTMGIGGNASDKKSTGKEAKRISTGSSKR